MKLSGWIFMFCAWGAIISVMIFAYGKVLSAKKKKQD
jgi:hypothetical protein